MYTGVYIYECVYVNMQVCMCVSVYVRAYVCLFVCICDCMYMEICMLFVFRRKCINLYVHMYK